jgi:antitoxin ParD1/3/4
MGRMKNMRDKKPTDANSTGEATRAGLHSLEDQDLRLERLRASLREGELSGDPMPFDMEQFIAEMKQGR